MVVFHRVGAGANKQWSGEAEISTAGEATKKGDEGERAERMSLPGMRHSAGDSVVRRIFSSIPHASVGLGLVVTPCRGLGY